MSEYEPDIDPDGYWSQDARDERDEWDLQVRAVDEGERDIRDRDAGERAA